MRDSNHSGRGQDVNDSGPQTTFELWNVKTRNQIASFRSEDEALSSVRQLIREHGRAYGARLALGREDSTGASHLIATGDDLVHRGSCLAPTRRHSPLR